MTKIPLTIVCPLFALNIHAALLPLQEARIRANEQNQPIVLLATGGDWLPGAEKTLESWKKLETAGADKAIWALYVQTAQETNESVREAKLPAEIYNLPEALVMTPQGRLVARIPAAVVRNGDENSTAVDKALETYKAQTDLLARADKAQGREKARLLGEALDTMALPDALSRKDLINALKKADPNDETGYVFKYELGAMPYAPGSIGRLYGQLDRLMTENGTKKGKARNFKAAEDFLRKKLELPVLDVPQKQLLNVALAYVARQQYLSGYQNAKRKMIACFETAAALAPETELGKGSRGYIDYYDKVIELYGLDFESVHMRREFSTWMAIVSNSIKKPGNYIIRIVKDGGSDHVSVRNVRIYVDGKKAAELPEEQQNKDSQEFELALPELRPGAHVVLQMDAKGNGHWMNCWGHIEIHQK